MSGGRSGERPSLVADTLMVLVVVVLVAVGVAALVRVGDLDQRRRGALVAARQEPGPRGEALQRFAAQLAPGERFALVLGDDIGPSEAQLLTLLAHAELFPAVATQDVAGADVLVTLGDVPERRRAGFATLATSADGWLGRRAP